MPRKKQPDPVVEVTVEQPEQPEEPETPPLEEQLEDQTRQDKILTTDNPWEMLAEARLIDLDQRAEHYERFVSLVAKKAPAERDQLVTQGAEVFKVRVDTIRASLKTRDREEAGLRQIVVAFQHENMMYETVYRREMVPATVYLGYNMDKPEDAPQVFESVKIGEKEYLPPSSMLADSGTILFAQAVEEYGGDWDLFLRLKAFIGSYLQLDSNAFQELLACYSMMTWVFDRFDALPYLRAQGDYGSGKTRLLSVVGSLSYRSLMAGGATTPSPVFRIIDRFKGTLIIDEADFEKTEMWGEIVKILNTGYTRGWPVLRTEKGPDGAFDVKAYDCFAPKILATRRRFQDAALESRCLSHTMPILTEFNPKMPLTLGKAFRQEAQQIRNQMMLWRFRNWARVEVDPNARMAGVEPRINQIAQPLMAATDSPKLKAAILASVTGYSKQVLEERRESLEGLVAALVVKRWLARQRPARFKLEEVTNTLKTMDFPNIHARKVGDIVRRVLGVETTMLGGDSWVMMNEETARKLTHRYGLQTEEAAVTMPQKIADSQRGGPA